MIIHVKPDKNHRPTYIYENEPVNRHPDLPPGAIAIGDVFHAIARAIRFIYRAIWTVLGILAIISILQIGHYRATHEPHIPVNNSGKSASEIIADS